MHERSQMSAIALTAALLMTMTGAAAFDDTQYPDFKGQWRAIGGPMRYDGSKPWGPGQEAPLTAEYQAIFEANLADQADPTQLINQIAQSGTITSVKSEPLNGVATKHYAITVDVQKMIATMGAGSAAEAQSLSALGIKSMPFDIWVNSDNLPVKITTKLAMSGLTGGGASEVDMTVTYSNWGESVNIQAPPADQVGGN